MDLTSLATTASGSSPFLFPYFLYYEDNASPVILHWEVVMLYDGDLHCL